MASSSSSTALADKYDVFFLDCDGTLYHEGELLPGIGKTLNDLKKMGKKVFYVTNTSSRDRFQLCDRLRKMGVKNASPKECYPSGVFAAAYIREKQGDTTGTKDDLKSYLLYLPNADDRGAIEQIIRQIN